MTIKELIEQLQQFDPNCKVACTWEGVINPIEVYQAHDGQVLIDSDGGDYRELHQKTKCEVCGKQAVASPWKKPICYEHWYYFDLTEKSVL